MVIASAGRETEPWPISRLLTYGVLPGVASLAVFVPVAKLLEGSGTPTMVALFVAIALGEVPASWFLMVRGVRREGRGPSVATLFPWRVSPGWLRLLLIGLALAAAGMMIVFGLEPMFGPTLQAAAFGWVPDWMIVTPGPEGMAAASRGGLVAVWALSGVVGVGFGGVTQELYHRGFLLPRSSHLGGWAVPFNGVSFALLHLAAPWGWPFFFLAGTVWAAATYRWKSVQLGLAGHVGMLALGWLMMTLVMFGVISMPA